MSAGMMNAESFLLDEDATLTDARKVAERSARKTHMPHLLLRPALRGVVFEPFTPKNDPQQNFVLPLEEALVMVGKTAGQVGLVVDPALPLKLRAAVEQIAIAATCTAGRA